ncbi:uncharacterized protein [Solanum tuberosum]|uniref:uncharacterized protein n=1 Tax=Solanum tuberosum TaxID=4113 RepID=UPI000739FE7B|nr:PREDICTED: uncharacterized protein LOC107059528 [Solanum tuberosum]
MSVEFSEDPITTKKRLNLNDRRAIAEWLLKESRVGRKRIQVDINQFKEIPLCRRTNIRSLSFAINMAKSTVFRRVKEGAIRPHTNAIKPHLTEENKKARLRFCLSMIDQSTLHSNPMFIDMFNYIHIDEKWFYLSKKSERYYLLPEEEESNPYRSCKSKTFITKVMFMAAVRFYR